MPNAPLITLFSRPRLTARGSAPSAPRYATVSRTILLVLILFKVFFQLFMNINIKKFLLVQIMGDQ